MINEMYVSSTAESMKFSNLKVTGGNSLPQNVSLSEMYLIIIKT